MCTYLQYMTRIFTSLQLTDILVNESHYSILTHWGEKTYMGIYGNILCERPNFETRARYAQTISTRCIH